MKNRLYILDFSRFLAALAVVLFHYLFLTTVDNGHTLIAFTEYSYLGQYGYLGVQFFFMISGFVVFMSAQGRKPSQFIGSRVSRLFPAYWFAVVFTSFFIVALGAEDFSVDPYKILWNLTMLQSFVGVRHIDGVYWTLTYELVFYFWILLAIILKKLYLFEKFSLLFLIIATVSSQIDFPKFIDVIFLVEYCPYFIAGVVFYSWYKNGFNLFRGILLIGCLSLSLVQASNQVIENSELFNVDFLFDIAAVIVSIFYVFFISLCVGWYKNFTYQWAVNIGALTYPLYLIHQNVGFIVFNQLSFYLNKYNLLMDVLLFSLLVSYFINIYIERKYAKRLRFLVEDLLKIK